MIYPQPRFLPCGDLAVSVELADEISLEANARVLALEYLIRQRRVAGITETLPTYRALLVYYEPSEIGFDALTATLRALAAEAPASSTSGDSAVTSSGNPVTNGS